MTSLTLHYHPLSSCCHKVMIALDELGVAVDKQLVNLGDAAEREAFRALSPTGKMPLLVDQGRPVPETSIIIEHVQRLHAAGGRTLIPDDPAQALQVRLWDRLFDFHVMTPMQALTADLLRPEAERDPVGVAQARAALASAYAMVGRQLAEGPWVTGETFSLADCAAAPSLFYAVTYLPVPPGQARLAAYVERLMDRPSVRRTIDEARPWFRFYPGRAGLAARFFDPGTE